MKITKTTVIALISCYLSVCNIARSADEESCTDQNRVYAGGGCFAIDVVSDGGLKPGQPLVVYMQDDAGSSKDGKYFKAVRAQFKKLRKKKLNVIAIARPGYSLPTGRTTGIYGPFYIDSYTEEVVDGLAAAIKVLKEQYRPSKLVLLGYSGGSMISAILLGRYAGLADNAVLVAWGCDTQKWLQYRIDNSNKKIKPWLKSLSAWDYIPKIPQATKIIVITGSKDRNTIPSFGKTCTAELKRHGVSARYESANGFDHISSIKSSVITKAVLEVAY